MPKSFRLGGARFPFSPNHAVRAALAGTLAAVSGAAGAQALDEVVVTAERRAMDLQETPLSIVAFDSESLKLRGVDNLRDVTAFAPNFQIKGARGQGDSTPSFSIRGISSGGAATSERSVALYVDGIPMPRAQGSLLSVVDVERIEVLRGPQGTLFGRNSTGGAVRIFTKQPHAEREAYLEVTGGNFDRYDVNGMVNVPLSDSVFVRGQVGYLHQDGFVRKGSQLLGGSEEAFARLQGTFRPGDRFSSTFTLSYNDSKGTGSPLDVFGFDIAPGLIDGNHADWLSDALVAAGQPPLMQHDPRLLLDDFTDPAYCLIDDFDPDWDAACEQKNDSRTWMAIANLQWTLGDATTLTSLTGYSDLDHSNVADWQGWGLEIRPVDLTSEVFFQEFQLNTAFFDGRLDFVTGLNFYYEDVFEATRTIQRRSTSTFSFATGPRPGNPPNADAGLFVNDDNEVRETSKSVGLFASGTWHVTDALDVTAGLRFAYDEKDIEATEFASSNFVPMPGTDRTTIRAGDSWDAIDWRFTADYDLTDSFMLYATVSKAYRAGTFTGINVVSNLPGDAQSAAARAVPPERVISREAGFRSEWFDRRLRFNATYFDMDYTDRQAVRQVSTPGENAPLFFRIAVVSSGDVEISGWELETQWAPIENLLIEASAGFLDYTVLDPVANSGPYLYPEPAEESFTIGGRYTIPLATAGSLSFSFDYSWQDAQQTHPTANGDSAYEMPSYGLVNGRIRYLSSNGRWELTLFGNNLANKTYMTFGTRFGGGFFDAGGPAAETHPLTSPQRSGYGAIRGRPREWGLTMQYHFF